jgi:hypothetical protein
MRRLIAISSQSLLGAIGIATDDRRLRIAPRARSCHPAYLLNRRIWF